MGVGCFLSFLVLIVFMFSASCDVLILLRWLRVLDFVYFVVLCMVENGMCVFLVIAGLHFAWRVLTPADLSLELFFLSFFVDFKWEI